MALFREPAGGVRAGLGIMMQAQDELADVFIAPAAVNADEVLDGRRKIFRALVMGGELFTQRFGGALAGFAFIKDGELGVESELVKMFADEPEAEAVEGADVREIEKRELAGPVVIGGFGGGFFLEFAAEALAEFGGGGLGEGDDEEFIERDAFAGEAVQAAFDEGLGLAGAGARHDQDVAARSDRAPLSRRKRVGLGGRGIHVAETLATDEHRWNTDLSRDEREEDDAVNLFVCFTVFMGKPFP